jgi:predicted aldo/keto reductase-like oxidoreductase
MNLSRRSFLGTAATGPLAALYAAEKDPKTGMPLRPLGRTGHKASLLAFGGGSRWLAYKDPAKAIPVLERALAAGVNYVDSAATYGNGQSERWIGEMLKTRKKDFFLVTKITARTADEAKRQIERSLKNFGLAQVDLMHMHQLMGEDDLALAEKKGNLIDILHEMRSQKVARFIGVTCHANPQVLRTALERHDFDSTQMALNVAQIGNTAPSNIAGQGMTGASGFEAIAMPVAVKKGIGLTAMKVFAQEKLLGKAAPDLLVRYAMSLPVAACTIGMPQVEHLDFNVNVAKNFKPLGTDDMQRLPASISAQMRASIDRFFADHIDC